MVTTRPRITKSIQLRVDINIHKRLKDIKGDRTWEDFLVEAGLQYGLVLEKARKWDEVEPYLPKLTANLLIEYLKKCVESMGFPDEEKT